MKKILLLTSMLLVSILFTAKAQVSQAEFDALVALYNATDGDNWTDNSNWNISGTKDDVTNDWKGITIYGGHIIDLSLTNNNLTGTLPSELGNLTYLTMLQLSRNNITGSIPTSIGNLTELSTLTLGNNQLSGSIPMQIGNLTNIRNLYLDHNSLTGTIPTEIGNLTELKYIRLRNNDLSGNIPSEIGNLTQLVHLYLEENQLTGIIPDEIVNLTKLQSIYIYNNDLSGSLPANIGNLTELTRLWIGGNNLTGSIPTSIGSLTKLTEFNAVNNNLTGEIPTSIGGLESLQRIYLYNNNLTGSIPSEIGNLTNLLGIRFEENQLTGSIPAEIENCTDLYFLYLNDNMLSGDIPEEIGNLINLKYLKLQGNQFTGEVPTEFQSLTLLQELYINDNQITGIPDLTSLPLTILDCQNNKLTFADIETNKNVIRVYSPQAKVGEEQNLYVATGTNKTISVSVDGNNNTYQWYKDGLLLTGATSDNYIVTNFQSANEGVYHCRIKNTVATVLTIHSNDITLSSSESPTIKTQPQTIENACVDGTAIFSVEDNYGETYQWQEKSPSGAWQDITDATNWTGYDTKSISSVKDDIKYLNGYSYRCFVTNPNGSANSNAVFLNTDSENPTLEVQSYTLELDETGAGTLNPSDFVVSASDNCSLADTTLNMTDFDCSDVGLSHGIFVRVYDNAGNYTQKTTNVIVVDNIAPALSVQNYTLQLDANGNATLKASDVITTASDNCTIVDTVLSKTAFNCSNIGTPVTVDITLSDVSGNETTKQVTITVVDNVDPVLSVQNHTLELDADGNATLRLSDVVTAASDNCELSDTTLAQTEFDCANVGTPANVNITLTDAHGNSITEQVTITVEDNIDPEIISTHNDKTVTDNGNCEASVPDYTGSLIATDNCDENLTITQFPVAGTTISGQIPVTLTAKDDSGNKAEVTFNLFVDDNTDPELVVKNITLQLDANGEATLNAEDVVTRATDNCTIADTTLSKTSFDCTNVGTPVTVDVTLSDEAGNSVTEQVTVTIEDKLEPVLAIQNATIYVDEEGAATLSLEDVVTATSDNCTIADTTLSKTNFNCANIGESVSVDITLTDANGNSVTETANITVLDDIKPVTPVLADVTNECSATITAPTTTDNCAGTITATTDDPLTYDEQGTHTVNWTFADGNGNSIEVEQKVIIDDVTDPTITCRTDTSIVVSQGKSGYTVAGVELDPKGTNDNCSVVSILNDFNNKSSLKDADLPTGTTTVVWTITDAAGNTSTCSYNVTISLASGIEDFEAESMGIYPNPAKTYIKMFSKNAEQIETITIFDCTGKMVISKNISDIEETIDISNLNAGIYFVNLKGEHQTKTFKLLKE